MRQSSRPSRLPLLLRLTGSLRLVGCHACGRSLVTVTASQAVCFLPFCRNVTEQSFKSAKPVDERLK
eukprot:2029442-Rhodomonas_salina.1